MTNLLSWIIIEHNFVIRFFFINFFLPFVANQTWVYGYLYKSFHPTLMKKVIKKNSQKHHPSKKKKFWLPSIVHTWVTSKFSKNSSKNCTLTFLFFFLPDNISNHILLKNTRRQLQIIEVQDLIHSKPEKFDLKQLYKQHTNITWITIEPLFTFKHNLNKEKDG
jgi:hypothetical protein